MKIAIRWRVMKLHIGLRLYRHQKTPNAMKRFGVAPGVLPEEANHYVADRLRERRRWMMHIRQLVESGELSKEKAVELAERFLC